MRLTWFQRMSRLRRELKIYLRPKVYLDTTKIVMLTGKRIIKHWIVGRPILGYETRIRIPLPRNISPQLYVYE